MRECVDNNQIAIFACSSLKLSYRDILRGGEGHADTTFTTNTTTTTTTTTPSLTPLKGVVFVSLKGSYDKILERMQRRKDHFMPPGLLKSQYDTLQELNTEGGEVGVIIDIDDKPASEIVAEIRKQLHL